MPSKPKLSTKTPDSDVYNTLITTHESIVAMPRERRYAIVELKTEKVNLDVDTGESQATMQVIHLEQPRSKADTDALVAMLDSLFTKRTKLGARPDPHAGEDTPLEGIGELDDSVSAQ